MGDVAAGGLRVRLFAAMCAHAVLSEFIYLFDFQRFAFRPKNNLIICQK